MNNKKMYIMIGSIIVGILLLIGFVHYIIYLNRGKNCEPFVGGGYTLKFNTDGGNKLENMSVCIACSPDSYSELPTPTKLDKAFDGWYYDKDLKKAVKAETTLKIEPVKKLDKRGCHVGYEDITLYAKWRDYEYSCEEGYSLNGKNCVRNEVVAATPVYSCTEGTLSNKKCVELKESGIERVWTLVSEDPEKSEEECLKVETNKFLDGICRIGVFEDNVECGEYTFDPTLKKCYKTLSEAKVTYKCSEDYKLNGTNCTKQIIIEANKK